MNKILASQERPFEDIIVGNQGGELMDLRKLMGAIEAILFVSGEPVGIDEIAKTLNISKEVVLNCFNIMKKDYESDSRGIMISMVGEKLLLKN